MRCTKQVLNGLGIKTVLCPKNDREMMIAFDDFGVKLEQLAGFRGKGKREVLMALSSAFPNDMFYVSVTGHAVGLNKGTVIDSAPRVNQTVCHVFKLSF